MSFLYLILIFGTSFFIVLLSTPILIKVAILKRLFDAPTEERKLHTRMIPTVGGVMIFAATLFAFALWFPIQHIHEYQEILKSIDYFKYLIVSILILFFIGVKDDIIGTAPIKKLVAQVIVGMMLVLMADIRISGFHGIFGVREIPYWASVFLSIFTFIVVINAFNLIDGIDGLAGGIGLIAAISFGVWFFLAGEVAMSALAFALAGSLFAFLIFNFSPAKIFMGDSGSLTIGLIVCVLAIKLIEFNRVELEETILSHFSKPVFAMAVLVYPLVDTLRIFIYRAVRGISPFAADRNHLHHKLLTLTHSHVKTTLIIFFFNILVIALSVFMWNIDPNISFVAVAGASLFFAQIPFFISNRRKKKKHV